ncbi:MAG: UvrD-helicase domain-containing protein [Euryarchaeota archaeon]|nr:UvrD-helicase domain-containing protein [Euryarchaeota archaeon]
MAINPLRSQRLGLDLDRHLAVDAGAGTGKTTVMSLRYVEHLLEEHQRATAMLPKGPRVPIGGPGSLRAPARELTDLSEWPGLLPSEVVAITFTNKAADELRQKIRNRLANLRDKPDPSNPDIIVDPRLRREGDVEQLISLLEEAPIGTIDSFLSGIVGPHLGMVSNDPSNELVSDAQRPLLVSRAINTAWRIQNSNHASSAGVEMDADVWIQSRNRLAWLLGGRNGAETVLTEMLKQHLFVEEAERELRQASGGVGSQVALFALQQMVLNSAGDFTSLLQQVHEDVQLWNSRISTNGHPFGYATSITENTRIACIAGMANEEIPQDPWDSLVWFHNLTWAIINGTSYLKHQPSVLAKGLPPAGRSDGGWPSGLENWTTVKKNVPATLKPELEEIANRISANLSTPSGRALRTYAKVAFLLHPTIPIIGYDEENGKLPKDIDYPLPRHLPSATYRLPGEVQVSMLEDLFNLHNGVQSILREIKIREGVYDHSDMQRYAEDLLLSRCPDICNWYPTPMVLALNSIDVERPWTDEHILRAIDIAPEGKDGDLAKADLSNRLELLQRIRRRYLSFIIDEYQDTNPQQYRLLARLWGRRLLFTGELEAPRGPWDPTICLVGDVKQSIYRFRQAQVTVMLRAIDAIRQANREELSFETRLRPFRKDNYARDPRPIAGGEGESSTFAPGTEYRGGERGSNDQWVRIDLEDDGYTAIEATKVAKRSEGHIDLTTNFRTAPNVLETLNIWFQDVLSERHDIIPGDWQARPQNLQAPPLLDGQTEVEGSIEWLVPVPQGEGLNPSTNLDEALNPFEIGKQAKPFELENEMIAARLHALITGQSIRIRGQSSEDDNWVELSAREIYSPEDILVLLPRRKHVDHLLGRLQEWGVPAQADKQGKLFSRPVVKELNHLLQLIARPNNRHAAAAFGRGCFVGFKDNELQKFFENISEGQSLLECFTLHAPTESQRILISHIVELSNRGKVLDALHVAMQVGDLFIAYPTLDAIQDSEAFIALVDEVKSSVGGDLVLLAEEISILAQQKVGALESKAVPPSGAIRVMTIHAAKGLESKVVVLGGLFDEGHRSSSLGKMSRFVVTPEIVAANLRPWRHIESPKSGVWQLSNILLDAQTDAERRRLFYVALTRVEEHLILVGAPLGCMKKEDGSLLLNRKVANMPSMGEMWLESMRFATHANGQVSTHWSHENDEVGVPIERQKPWETTLDPISIYSNPSLGGAPLSNLVILHDPACLPTISDRNSVRDAMVQHLERGQEVTNQPQNVELPTGRNITLKLAAHRLDSSNSCLRRVWLNDIKGWSTEAIIPKVTYSFEYDDENEGASIGYGGDYSGEITGEVTGDENVGLPEPANFGSLYHRLVEVGIGNPAQKGSIPDGLNKMWTMSQKSKLLDDDLIEGVILELASPDIDNDETAKRLRELAQIQENSMLGKLCDGDEIDGQLIDGLRTEIPFHLAIEVDPEKLFHSTWTLSGESVLANITSAEVLFDGRIDLAIAIKKEDGGYLRVIDIKTEGCVTQWDSDDPENGHALQAAVDSPEDLSPQNEAEINLLHSHRLQLALYTIALERGQSEIEVSKRRKVLPPAIQVGASGRLIALTEAEISAAKMELNELLLAFVTLHLNPNEEPERLTIDEKEICSSCPHFNSQIRLCGPLGEELGPRN